MKHDIKRKRRAILKEINRLNELAKDGEDVEVELRQCGEQLETLVRRSIPDNDINRGQGRPKLIPDALVEQAAKNGINYQALKERLFRYGWSQNRAMTQPLTKKKRLEDSGITVSYYQILKEDEMADRDIAEKFELSYHTLQKFKRENGLLVQRKREEA